MGHVHIGKTNGHFTGHRDRQAEPSLFANPSLIGHYGEKRTGPLRISHGSFLIMYNPSQNSCSLLLHSPALTDIIRGPQEHF